VKKRATIVISGDVQDVGFRGTIMRLAQKANLTGYVENLPNGTVRAVCEGEEKSIKGLIKKLDIRNGDIYVEKIEAKWSKVQGKFKYFEVKHSDLGAEMFQGFATAGRKLSAIDHNLGNKIEAMHLDMNTRFDTLDNKYGEIGEKMTTLEHNIGDLTWQIKRLVDHVVGEVKEKRSE
jgi:acylphosphatase